MYRLEDKDLKNLITAMSMYAIADMKDTEKPYEVSWVWSRMSCIHRFQRRFNSNSDYNDEVDTEFKNSLHEACERLGITREREEKWSNNWDLDNYIYEIKR